MPFLPRLFRSRPHLRGALLTCLLTGLAAPVGAQTRWWERVGTPSETSDPTGVQSAPEEIFPEPSPGDTSGFQAAVTGLSERPEYAWHWQRVLSVIRISSRFTAITSSSSDPDEVYLGTDAYTVVRTLDGGVTWDEIELSPFLNQRRQVATQSPRSPNLQGLLPSGFNIYVDPPFRQSPPIRVRPPGDVGFSLFFNFARPAALGEVRLRSARFPARAGGAGGETVTVDAFSNSSDFGDTAGNNRTTVSSERSQSAGALGNVTPQVNVGNVEYAGQLLEAAAAGGRSVEVVRIEMCPGAAYPLMVATETEILGSDDDGTTWVRLFRLYGGARITNNEGFDCTQYQPNIVMVATTTGSYFSLDGGLTFDQDFGSWPGRATTAVGVDPVVQNRVYIGVGSRMFAGDIKTQEGFDKWVYPDFNNTATAPWETINWITPTLEGNVWLGTYNGLRVSRDRGQTWENVAPLLLGNQRIPYVIIGENEVGGSRIAVPVRNCHHQWRGRRRCRRSLILASDNGGEDWFPFFDGAVRRGDMKLVAGPSKPGEGPRWWAASGGELWATIDPAVSRQHIDRESQDWARQRILDSPTPAEASWAVLERLSLRETDLVHARDQARARAWVPFFYITAEFELEDSFRNLLSSPNLTLGAADVQRTRDVNLPSWEVIAFLNWELGSTAYWAEQSNVESAQDLERPNRRGLLYALAREVTFIIADAMHERDFLLARLAQGMSDRLHAEIFRQRIESLEALIETWMEQPLQLNLRRYRQ